MIARIILAALALAIPVAAHSQNLPKHARVRRTVSNASLLNNIVSFWEMDETGGLFDDRTDFFGRNPFASQLVGFEPGIRNMSANPFDDTNAFMLATNNPSLCFTNQSFSIQAWVRITTETNSLQYIFGKWGTNLEYGLILTNSRFKFFREKADRSAAVSVSADNLGAPAAYTWYHLVFGQDLGAGQIFIQGNGGTRSTTTFADAGYSGAADLLIGVSGVYSFPFGGDIDLVGLWNRVLTTNDASLMYNGGSGRDPVTQP